MEVYVFGDAVKFPFSPFDYYPSFGVFLERRSLPASAFDLESD